MIEENIKATLKEAFEDAQISIQGSGCDFQLSIVSEHFNGLSLVQRQKKVYQYINSFIVDGSVHAVSMKLMTPLELSNN